MKTSTAQAKPKCGVGQSCGFSCISIKDTCKDKIDPGTSAGLIHLVQNAALYKAKSLQSFTSAADEGKTFDELAAKYPFKAGAGQQEKIGGLSIWYLTMEASDGSGDKMTYAVAEQDKRSFTLSDGNVKEVLASDRNAKFKEGLAAALRAKATDIVNDATAEAEAVKAKAKADAPLAEEAILEGPDAASKLKVLLDWDSDGTNASLAAIKGAGRAAAEDYSYMAESILDAVNDGIAENPEARLLAYTTGDGKFAAAAVLDTRKAGTLELNALLGSPDKLLNPEGTATKGYAKKLVLKAMAIAESQGLDFVVQSLGSAEGFYKSLGLDYDQESDKFIKAKTVPAKAAEPLTARKLTTDSADTVKSVVSDIEGATVLGKGQSGTAYLTSKQTVVKTVNKGLKAPLVADVEKEARGIKAIADLGLGPKLIAYDTGTGSIETERANGSILYDVIKRPGVLNNAIKAMVSLHKAGYTHGDLHQGNVMIDKEGNAALIDAAAVNKVGEGKWHEQGSGLYDLSKLTQDVKGPAAKLLKLVSEDLKQETIALSQVDLADRAAKNVGYHQSYIESITKRLIELGLD